MRRDYLLRATALLEGGIALLLLVWPPAPLVLLLGVGRASAEVTFLARITGSALLAISVACWLGRSDTRSPAQFGLLAGVLTYDVAATGILAFTGFSLALAGIALWPAVMLHGALAAWCVLCLWGKTRDEDVGTHRDRKAARGDEEASGS